MARSTIGKKDPYVWKVMFYGKITPLDSGECFLGGTILGAQTVEAVEEYCSRFTRENPTWIIHRHTIQKLGIRKGKTVAQGRW